MNRTEQNPAADKLAQFGRGGDTEMAHVTPGETIVPHSIQTPEVMNVLSQEFNRQGVPMDRYVVQGKGNSINPKTGKPEYFLKKLAKAATGAAIGFATGGPAGAVMGGVNGLMAEDAAGNPVPAGSPTAVNAGSPTASVRATKDPRSQITPSYKTQVPIKEAQPPVTVSPDTPPLGHEHPKSGLNQNYESENSMEKAIQALLAAGAGGMNSLNPVTGIPEYFDYYGDQMAPSGGNSVNPKTGKKEFADFRGDYDAVGVYNEPIHPSERAARAAGYKGDFGAGGADDYLKNNPEANNIYRTHMGYAPQVREGASYVSPVNIGNYKDEDYYGGGRNEIERGIRALGYAGGFGRGQADQWLHSKYGSGYTPELQRKAGTILNPPKRPTYDDNNNFTQSNPNWARQGEQPEWVGSIMDKFDSLLSNFTSSTSNDNQTESATQTPAVTRVSSQSPTRSPRFKSRRFSGGSMARNF